MKIYPKSFEKIDNSVIKKSFSAIISVIGPVVVKQATASKIASSNRNSDTVRMIVKDAVLTINNMKKIHAMKTEIFMSLKRLFFTATEDGWSNFPVSFENAENKIEILSSLIPPAVVATPPPNKHKPMRIITVYDKSTEESDEFQKELT